MAKLETLRQARARRNLSVRELAVLAGVSPVTVWELETGRRTMPLPRTMRRLAGALGCKDERQIAEFVEAQGRTAQGRA